MLILELIVKIVFLCLHLFRTCPYLQVWWCCVWINILCWLQALSLLTYLLQTADPEHVSQLDPFPEALPLPAELTKQMEEEASCIPLLTEINRFLSVGVYSSRTEGLRAMTKLLHHSRFEMAAIIKQGKFQLIKVPYYIMYILVLSMRLVLILVK